MQSAQKQKPYLMRLSTIFGDKNMHVSPAGQSVIMQASPAGQTVNMHVSPAGQSVNNFNLQKPSRQNTMKSSKPPKYGELSPFMNVRNIEYCISPNPVFDSQ